MEASAAWPGTNDGFICSAALDSPQTHFTLVSLNIFIRRQSPVDSPVAICMGQCTTPLRKVFSGKIAADDAHPIRFWMVASLRGAGWFFMRECGNFSTRVRPRERLHKMGPEDQLCRMSRAGRKAAGSRQRRSISGQIRITGPPLRSMGELQIIQV